MRSLERKPIYFEDLISRVKMFFIVVTVAIVCLFLAVAMRRPDDEKWNRPLWKRPYPAEKDQNDISVKSGKVGTEITGLDKTTSSGHKNFNNQNDIAVKISEVVSETLVVDTTKSSVQSYSEYSQLLNVNCHEIFQGQLLKKIETFEVCVSKWKVVMNTVKIDENGMEIYDKSTILKPSGTHRHENDSAYLHVPVNTRESFKYLKCNKLILDNKRPPPSPVTQLTGSRMHVPCSKSKFGQTTSGFWNTRAPVIQFSGSHVQSNNRPDISPKSAGKTMPVKPLTHETDPNTIKEKELQQREKFIHDYCKANHHIQLTTEDEMKFVYSEKYNLYAIPIQKIGSTFLKLMFYILKNGASEAEKEFNRSRTKVQTDSDMRASKLTPAQLNNSTIIAPVRNPYSRLFAAYVDKIYLPNTRSLIQAVVRYHHEHDNTLQKSKPFLENILGQSKYSNTLYEEHMVSFQDFLSYALFSNGPVVLQNHFDPCFPRLQKLICNINNYIVVKQESFADDIKYALRKVNLDKRDADSYDVILKSLEQSRAEITIPGIIKTALSKFSEENKVWNRQILVERLWHSFQIQGYIDKKSHFPYKLFSSDFEITDSYVIRVILKEIETHPLSPTDRKKQRADAMLGAFRQVDDTLLKKIQSAYSDDFSAFNYSKTL